VELSNADEIAAAFNTVDALLEQATTAAPAVALLLARAQEQGVTEARITNHLGLNATVVRWLQGLQQNTADRSAIEDTADLGELLLKWARS
jgi:hypothetical protein